MNASTPRIVAPGDLSNERVTFTIKEGGELSFYVLIDSKYVAGPTIEAGLQLAYWFGGTGVEMGDHVIVYTKSGTESRRKRDDGFHNHFFYRGLDQPTYGDPSACVVLAELAEWSTSARLKATQR